MLQINVKWFNDSIFIFIMYEHGQPNIKSYIQLVMRISANAPMIFVFVFLDLDYSLTPIGHLAVFFFF
jgi:hypothetical protein